mmetsp:Transcript_22928/g.74259  ORF Transcript_22928/g.74259 Transcript_22928/m.74259 type:complete len:721 (-) Transcript_22928:402-2564(-)
MLACKRQSFPLTIEIPVEEFFSEIRTPKDVAAGKRSALSTPRVSKSPEDLRKVEDDCARRYCLYIESVQARAARESQRAVEAKARRLRSEASARQRLESRFDAVAKRDTLKLEETRQKAEEKAQLRRERAREAKYTRKAIQAARDEKLAFASVRVENSARRAANAVQITAVKSALVAKRAVAVVAAQKQLQRDAALSLASSLTSRMTAAAERRNDLLELAQPRVALRRVEMARAQQAKDAVGRLEKKVELDRSIAAAIARRDGYIQFVVSKARVDLSRVQATVQAREVAEAQAATETRRAVFSKLNAADVRAKALLLRKASTHPIRSVSFELPVRPTGQPMSRLPALLVSRLMTKSIKTCPGASKGNKALQSAAERAARANAARVAFAIKNSLNAKLAATARATHAAALKQRVVESSRRGTALAQHHLQCRARVAHGMNKRVAAAAVRRAATAAALRMLVARNSLCAVAAAGLRAERLLSISVNEDAVARRTMAAAKRADLDAKRSSAAVKSQLRCLVGSLRASELLAMKSLNARTYSLPYQAMRGALRPTQAAPTKPEPAAAVSAPMFLGRTPPMHRPTKPIAVSPVGVESVPVEDSEPAVAAIAGAAIFAHSPAARRPGAQAVSPPPQAAVEAEEQHELELARRIVAHNTAKRACKLACDKLMWQVNDAQGGKRTEADKPDECLFARVAKKHAMEMLKKEMATSADGEEEWQLVDVMP